MLLARSAVEQAKHMLQRCYNRRHYLMFGLIFEWRVQVTPTFAAGVLARSLQDVV